MKHSKSKTPLDNYWFICRGYRKHPRLNLWAKEGCAHFLSAYGHKLAHEYCPQMRAKSKDRGYTAPNLRSYKPRMCHVLMGEIFYGDRPVFINRKGKPYFGVCHHLIEDPLDYRPENLLCWLTYEQHAVADKRRRALEKLVPDLRAFPILYLREIQDPRVTSNEDFNRALDSLKPGFVKVKDPMELDMSNHREF